MSGGPPHSPRPRPEMTVRVPMPCFAFPFMSQPERPDDAPHPCAKRAQRGIGCFGMQLRQIAGCIQAVLLVCVSFVLCLGYALPAHALSDRPYEVAIVLHGQPGDTEKAFEEYFAKRKLRLHTTLIEYSGNTRDQPALVTRLRRLAPDLIYTSGTEATLAVAGPLDADPKRYLTGTPVVFTSVSDPIAAGLVSDLKRPGRALTGVIPLAPLSAQLSTIAAYRHFTTLGYLYKRSSQTSAVIDRLHTYGQKHGFKLVDQPVPLAASGAIDVAAIPVLVANLKREGVDFLYIGPETFVSGTLQNAVAKAAMDTGLPTYSALENAVRHNGALLGLYSPENNLGRLAALKATRILSNSVAPGDEPIESLERFSIIINMQTARRLEAYPPLLLLDAADVIRD